MHVAINAYNSKLNSQERLVCQTLANCIKEMLPEADGKIWHAHPVWFLNDNPIVGYSKQKAGIRLMFWSGADFEENELIVRESKFKDASIFYQSVDQIDINNVYRWLKKSRVIQWDYKNIVKRKGVLEKLIIK